MKAVRREVKCSAGFLYNNLYAELERRRRSRANPSWPKVIGLDEHFFRRAKTGYRSFVSVVTDIKNKRLVEVVDGVRGADLEGQLRAIPGRENVELVALDMSGSFRSFAKGFFPNAKLVADKFHVVRLLHPAITRKRRELVGHTRGPGYRGLLMNGDNLSLKSRFTIKEFLRRYPDLLALWQAKEDLHTLYRTKGHRRAAKAVTRLTDRLAHSALPELQTFRRTLLKWRTEILNYFKYGITNARTEGVSAKGKLVKRRAYGYTSFTNYRLRLLNACSGRSI